MMKNSRISQSWDAVNPAAGEMARMQARIAQGRGATRVPRWPVIVSAGAVLVAAALVVGVVTLRQPRPGPVVNLMANLTTGHGVPAAMDAQYEAALADFSVRLLQQSVSDKNVLLSPLSVELALTMTANGAAGLTLQQMQQVLGGDADIATINAMLSGFVKGLPNTKTAKFSFADSIWFRQLDGFKVSPGFLQTNADYFAAGAYAAPFDQSTVDAINAWVKQNTDGMVPKIIDQLKPDDMMVLLNALAFDAEWQQQYMDGNVADGVFRAPSGPQDAKFMASTEYTYLNDGRATGFVKPYAGGAYSFVALLPNDGVSITDYVASLTGAGWLNTMRTAAQEPVAASLPEFSFSYQDSLVAALTAMGMPAAFSDTTADFGPMVAAGPPLYIGDVVHATSIDVTPLGTKAGAATAVIMPAGGMMTQPHIVNLDRPFVFAIADTATGLPLFIGVTNSVA